MKRLLFLSFSLFSFYPHPALLAQSALESELRALVSGFKGDVGIYVEHLGTGETIAIQADSLFPTASMVKVPILVGIFSKLESGELTYDAPMSYDTTFVYPGTDVVGQLTHGAEISLHKTAFLMMSFSDNTASLWLQHLAGTGTVINERMDALGLSHTRVNSRTPGREEIRLKYGWGVTTPREMATLMKKIHLGEVVSPAASEEMIRLMSKSLWDKEALSAIPPYVEAASKQGAVSHSRSEVVLVHSPTGPYVFCVITKNQEDRSWNVDNAGYVLLRQVSAALWEQYAPGDTWEPKEGSSRYQ
jgi:beta-lactamase class A